MGTKHKIDYKRSGKAITPVCSCGWSGETVGPGHREWDRQFESVVDQGKAHAKAAKASNEITSSETNLSMAPKVCSECEELSEHSSEMSVIELGIPNEHLLRLVIDESKDQDMFKAILAQDINICISRVNAELRTKRHDSDIEFYRSMLRLIRRLSESEGLDFIEREVSAKKDKLVIH